MKSASKIFWGSLLIAVGVIYGLNALEITNINLFFDGWWTLFIIVPSVLNLIKGKDLICNLIGLVIGASLLLSIQGIVSFEYLGRLVIPTILIISGLTILFKNKTCKFSEKINKINKDNKASEYFAMFGSQEIVLEDEFKNLELNAVFGGIKCDLRKAVVKDDAVINVTTIFGGTELLVSDDVEVEIVPIAMFGSVENNREVKDRKSKKTIYINATCLFGGVEIK